MIQHHPFPSPEDKLEIADRLRHAIGSLVRQLRRTRAGFGLTSTETRVLSLAVVEGPVGLARFVAAEGMNPTMVSRLIRRLEHEGLVVREPDPTDRRAATVTATAKGRRLWAEIRNERTDALNILVSELNTSELRALGRALPVLERIIADLASGRLQGRIDGDSEQK